jgi:hypothetical protein
MQMSAQIERKTQELSYALIRIAAYIRKKELKSRIDALSFKFTQHVGEGKRQLSLADLNGLKNLVELGKHLLQIEPINAKLILREIETLSQAIRQYSAMRPLPDIGSFFSDIAAKEPVVEDNTAKKIPITVSKEKPKAKDAVLEFAAEIRQGKILEKVRQSASGRIQLKDLLGEFPGVSERTIRYDLKKLADEGKLTRQGTGGPSNYYVLNQRSTPTGSSELSTGVINS